ncbi:nodulation protein NolB [Methylobacterium sp. J-076]|uniref:nodulation protein NolB n=1 Tax=Methylobacterium sp. J-076 TaxID=2836655 RepID=UPI001FBAA6F5|nr:nodulation protein NolB [Methylobacterium sp. J-076]MCJ2013125.1 hypothetical protein [Methylobacterium sp. J-076]
MAIEAIAPSLGGAGMVPSAPGAAGFGGHGADAAQSFESLRPAGAGAVPETRPAGPGGPAEAPPRAPAAAEVNARPRRSEPSIGDRVLDRLNAVQKGDAATKGAGPAASAFGYGQAPQVARVEPGPAAIQLRPAPAEGPAGAGPSGGQPDGFRPADFTDMLNQLRQVSSHVVQVSVVTKTTGSFTGSLNKLLSQG